jgi:hypothetical protein
MQRGQRAEADSRSCILRTKAAKEKIKDRDPAQKGRELLITAVYNSGTKSGCSASKWKRELYINVQISGRSQS